MEEALEKAILAEQDPVQWKYAIFSLVQSIELILKERLRQEHWLLIFENVDKPNKTVGLDSALKRIESLNAVILSKEDKEKINEAKNWRNLIIHYELEVEPDTLKIVFAKLLGFSSHFNKKEFDIFLEAEIDSNAWDEALKIFEYENELINRGLKLIEEEGILHDLILECPNCKFDMFVIQDNIDTCYLCGYTDEIIECGECKEFCFRSQTYDHQTGDNRFELFCEECHEIKEDEEMDEYLHEKMMEYHYRNEGR